MQGPPSPSAKIKPAGIYSYVDAMTVWLKAPLGSAELAWIRSQCGQGGMRPAFEPAAFNPRYRQRLQLSQPSCELLEWLAGRDDAHVNYVEISLDWTFDSEHERDEAHAFLCRHLVKRHHGKQGIRFHEGTRYTGPRQAPNVIAMYADKPSRITGEVYCLHIDWRIRGKDALQRAGIASPADLLVLDHREFWKQRLLLRGLDLERLGRMYSNMRMQRKRKAPLIYRTPDSDFTYPVDRRRGGTIMRSLGSVQAVIDKFQPKMDVKKCLLHLDVEHLLPEMACK